MVMAIKTATTYASSNIARDFARTMNEAPAERVVRLIGRRGVKALLHDITKGGKTSLKAKVVFR